MPSTPASAESVRAQIEALRKKLLDLSLRNRMLNYRPSKRLGVTVVGESSFEVHRMLVEEGKKMSFTGQPDPPKARGGNNRAISGLEDDVAMAEFRKAAEEEMDAFISNAARPIDQMDTKLSTEEYESVLQLKLRTLQREASLADEELGINTLFLTLGTLEWNEGGERTFRSPLLYIPVRLERQANGGLKISHDGGDVGQNLPLRAKMLEFNLQLPEYDDEKTILDYFQEVESTVRRREGWQVHYDEICLGFFNYEKYSMYVDLGGEIWPEERKPWMDEDATAMLGGGYSSPATDIDDHSFIDDYRPVAESREVYDADSSQTIAMIRAKAGLSIVVEGPPGTGKSQTITNIIAEAVADGKSVLFVSAKRAALDVVKRKMEEAELGAMCLDLHDKLTNRREFYGELKRTVSRSLQLKDEEQRVARLTELRDRINAHSSDMSEPLTEYGLTVFAAMTQLARLPKETSEDREGRIPFERLKGFTHDQIRAALPTVIALQTRLAATGVPMKNPYWGVNLAFIDPARRLDLEDELTQASAAIAKAEEAFEAACQAFTISIPGTADNVHTLRACAERAWSAPTHDGVAIRTDTWKAEEPKIRRVIEALRTKNRLRAARQSQIEPTIWSAPIPVLAKTYETFADRWTKFLNGEYRNAKRTLAAYLTASAPTAPTDQRDLLIDLRTVVNEEAEIQTQASAMQRLFGVQWQGLDTDPEILDQLLTWVLTLHAEVHTGQLPAGLLEFFEAKQDNSQLLATVEAAESASEKAMERYRKAADLLEFPTDHARKDDWETLSSRVANWRDNLPQLADYIAMNEARRHGFEKNLESVIEVADRWPLASERLGETFLRSYYTGVVRDAMQARPSLRAFERAGHEAMIDEFCDLDDFKLRYNRAQVRLAHHRRLPTFETAVGNLQLLKVQCELQRRHKPIRWIMARAGEAIQRIKPVFMMSPLSVAIHLPPELPPFDMVIFDEASQVKPEDALCAIVRANQTIVVGDTRQMPPTSFFDRVADDDEEVEDPEDEFSEMGQEARKLESILSMMSAVTLGAARRPDLRWHYRSVHPALIQPSNEMFYENRLVVFPSPGVEQGGRRVGVVFHHHPDTVYEPGATKRTNLKEAQLVAQAVLRHVKENPTESLMVAAMNKSQADLIYDEVAKLERTEPEPFIAFRDRHPHEPLVIKNLENVQGDERDVVMISVTYGRDSAGVIRQQFGPLLRDGGERRLNVLITRARRRCEVFSNLTADDLRADGARLGVTSLKRYLKFAQTGQIEIALATGRGEESPFEEEVGAALRKHGYQVHPQVGSEGYRIDLAVVDPEAPGRYLIGIECDGATYHSARSARDRDKLRQRVLESRGWIIHRIWSSDWWQDRDTEIARLLKAIEGARQEEANPTPPPTPAPEPEESFVEETETAALPDGPPAYRVTPASTGDDLAKYLIQVVNTEGPIHFDLLMARLREASGQPRLTAQVRVMLDELISHAAKTGKIKIAGDALYTEDAQLQALRDWSELPGKKIDWVPQIELANALRHVIGESFGVTPEAAIRSAFARLGFKRTTESAQEKGAAALAELLANRLAAEKEGLLYPPNANNADGISH